MDFQEYQYRTKKLSTALNIHAEQLKRERIKINKQIMENKKIKDTADSIPTDQKQNGFGGWDKGSIGLDPFIYSSLHVYSHISKQPIEEPQMEQQDYAMDQQEEAVVEQKEEAVEIKKPGHYSKAERIIIPKAYSAPKKQYPVAIKTGEAGLEAANTVGTKNPFDVGSQLWKRWNKDNAENNGLSNPFIPGSTLYEEFYSQIEDGVPLYNKYKKDSHEYLMWDVGVQTMLSQRKKPEPSKWDQAIDHYGRKNRETNEAWSIDDNPFNPALSPIKYQRWRDRWVGTNKTIPKNGNPFTPESDSWRRYEKDHSNNEANKAERNSIETLYQASSFGWTPSGWGSSSKEPVNKVPENDEELLINVEELAMLLASKRCNREGVDEKLYKEQAKRYEDEYREIIKMCSCKHD